MTIEAPLSNYKKNNLKIFIVMLAIGAVWFGYDGYFNAKFIEMHKDKNGKANSTLVFNQKSPPFFIGGAVLIGLYLFTIANKKIIADENELIIGGRERIPYESIEKIDKTNFDSKGCFTITYKNKAGGEVNRRLSDKTYDNLAAILEHLVAKISSPQAGA
jgi:hypothetical protein